jgi:hypothetical protein
MLFLTGSMSFNPSSVLFYLVQCSLSSVQWYLSDLECFDAGSVRFLPVQRFFLPVQSILLLVQSIFRPVHRGSSPTCVSSGGLSLDWDKWSNYQVCCSGGVLE